MGLTISNTGGDYENLEPGRYQATCYKLIDAGTREESYQEGPLKKRHIVYIYWEVTAKQEVDDAEEHWEPITMDDGRLFSASKKYTASLNENATLFKDLKSWRGKPFSEEDLNGFEQTFTVKSGPAKAAQNRKRCATLLKACRPG